MLIHLRVDPSDSGWTISLRERGTRGVRGAVPAGAIDAIRLVQQRLGGGAVVLLPGQDSRQTAAEERLGRALSAAVAAAPEAAREWARLLGVAEGRAEPVAVALDAEAYDIRSLPWELIAADPDSAPLEGQGGGLLRLAPGRPAAPPRSGPLQTVTWIPQPDDPSVTHVAARLSALCAEHGLPAPTPAGGAPCPGGPVVLHIVCHGQALADQLRLIGGGDLSTGSTVHLLSPLLPSVDLVVLSVCEGGADLPRELDGLAERLIAAGARAVVSASGTVSVEALARFLSGTYGALASGAALLPAVTAGRRAVRALASPYPDARWHRIRLTAGDLQAAQTCLLDRTGWTPPGWPRPAPGAAQHLDGAYRIAAATGGGFLGIEHLALALAEQPPRPGLEAVRYPLGLRTAEIRDGLAQLMPTPGRASPATLSLTPRLEAVGALLQPGFTVLQLWQALLDRGAATVQLLSGSTALTAAAAGEVATVQTWNPDASLHAALPDALELISGPEDGRRLRLSVGETVGRWAVPARSDILLYATTFLTDPSLSRRHLSWSGPGTVELLTPARALHHAGKTERKPRGPRTLQVGDQLWLSRATCLLAVPDT